MWKEEEVTRLLDLYRVLRSKGDYDISPIALALERNRSSIINKLVKLGVYVVKPKKLVITKKTLVRELNRVLKAELWSLGNANKDDLKILLDRITD